MLTTTTNLIRKEAGGGFRFLTSALPTACMISRDQLIELIKELERLRDTPLSRNNIPVAWLPDSITRYGPLRLCIRKDLTFRGDGVEYQLMANLCGDFLCLMNQADFERLIKDLIELRDYQGDIKQANFPDFTYTITG